MLLNNIFSQRKHVGNILKHAKTIEKSLAKTFRHIVSFKKTAPSIAFLCSEVRQACLERQCAVQEELASAERRAKASSERHEAPLFHWFSPCFHLNLGDFDGIHDLIRNALSILSSFSCEFRTLQT